MNDDLKPDSVHQGDSEDHRLRDQPEDRLSQELVQSVFDQHATGLKSFLLGVLKDDAAANDAMQATFVQLMEKGHTIKSKDLTNRATKSWLFRVAFNEAMLVKRKEQVVLRHQENVAWLLESRNQSRTGDAVEVAIHSEEVGRVQQALQQLSEEQKLIVVTRIYEGLKFREIAEKLGVPLGTVLSRMQAGLKRLKTILEEE